MGWKVEQRHGSTVFLAPEGTLRVTLSTSREPDSEQAIALAWERAHPGVALVKDSEPVRSPPTRGWKRALSLTARGLRAEARQYEGITYVLLIEGDEASLARREAQVSSLLESLAPHGMKEETFAGRTPRALDQAALDRFLFEALNRLEVPGAAVAITLGGRVIYERSLGVRSLEKPEPITPHTLFLMASVTKPMTTLMEASLVDSGLLSWESKVAQLLPGFALGDPALTSRLALWHMSCACTGMPRRDLENLFEYGDVTPEQRIASMAQMKPTTGLGETFQYSNLMVAAGGFAAAHVYAPKLALAQAYARVMHEKLFGPIGMLSSTVDFAVVVKSEHASPHALDLDGRPQVLALQFEGNVLPIAPAGAVWSNLRDMERYLLTELGRGVAPGGTRVVSEANFAQRLRPRAPDSGYGLGVGVERQAGLLHLGHDGGSDGFGTSLVMWPELDLGLVILTNVRNGTAAEQLPFNAAVKRRVLELLFAGADDVASVMLDFALTQRRAMVGQQSLKVERQPEASWFEALTGHYESLTLGGLDIRPGGVFDVGEWQVHFGRRKHGERTELVVLDAPFAGASLPLGADGSIWAPDPQASDVFRRAPPTRAK